MTFTHLQTASAFSMRHGTALPEKLVSYAKFKGFTRIALTDRDEIGGAVRFVRSCIEFGITPILGIDLAIKASGITSSQTSTNIRRTPAHGGKHIDPKHPRFVLLGRGRHGWPFLSKISSISASNEYKFNSPVISINEIGKLITSDFAPISNSLDAPIVALWGWQSEFAQALHGRRPDVALALIQHWKQQTGLIPVIAITSHGHQTGLLSNAFAARMLKFADEHGLKAVLTNTVRYLDPQEAPIADLLDAIRQLIPLTKNSYDPGENQSFLKTDIEMTEVALAITRDATRAKKLLLDTELLASSCALDSVRDLGWGRVHLPELGLLTMPTTSSSESIRHQANDASKAQAILRSRTFNALERYGLDRKIQVKNRLDEELAVVAKLGFAAYFLTVASVVDDVKTLGSRVNARGSAAGSLIVHLLGISSVNPLDHGLLMERFLSPERRSLPDIDIDVESDRRLDIYRMILNKFGKERVAAVSMLDTYRVRHAIRDVGAALMLPAGEISALATSFPHIRARDIRAALNDLPELRNSSYASGATKLQFNKLFDFVEALDALPRHRAMHPCGVVISDAGLLNRIPVQPSGQDFPMTAFDKDDVEDLGLIKLDVLGVRMQSAIRHALTEIERVTERKIDLEVIPVDDQATYDLIKTTQTLGCFQIESPGQRELIGKLAPQNMHDLIVDISLFRPGPVKSDMVKPFLEGRHGWAAAKYPHPDLKPVLQETFGVVVFHEQVMQVFSVMTGCTLAVADEYRRGLGTFESQAEVKQKFYPAALKRGYELNIVEEVWQTLKAFGSFGFCKAHAAAFAIPTYQSAWLKAHYPAAFLAGVLTHDPGMYPKRLILNDARNFGIKILGLDINKSKLSYQVEIDDLNNDSNESNQYAIRISFLEILGISTQEAEQIVLGQPYGSLSDFFNRVPISRPVVERLITTGAFDELHRVGNSIYRSSRSRRDLLLELADLVKFKGVSKTPGQLFLEIAPDSQNKLVGLPEMTPAEQVKNELRVLGLDATNHVLSFHFDFLKDLSSQIALISSQNLLTRRSRSEIFVAGVKVATQTPPIRSGKRVVFVTLDDGSGPIDIAFFDEAQHHFHDSIFNSWLVLVKGLIRRTGPRAVSISGLGCWQLTDLHQIWREQGVEAVINYLNQPVGEIAESTDETELMAVPNASRDRRLTGGMGPARKLLLHASGLVQSPYADIAPSGNVGNNVRTAANNLKESHNDLPAHLWHKSPGSSGR